MAFRDVHLDLRVYPKESITRALGALDPRCLVTTLSDQEHGSQVIVRLSDAAPGESLDALVRELHSSLSRGVPPQPPNSSLSSVAEEIEQLKTSAVGQEHRLMQVLSNAYQALRSNNGWPLARRLEAAAAVVRYFFIGRPIIFLSLGLGGLFALHASFMLADQNRKLDLQNYLSTVSSELAEAQRNSQFVQLIAPLIADIQSATENQKGVESRTGREVVQIDPQFHNRIAGLTQTFQPYRWIQQDIAAGDLIKTQGEGVLYRSMSSVRRVYDAAFGRDEMSEQLSRTRVPTVTAARLSPERGVLLINLYALSIDFRGLTRWNATFRGAYAPGARLDAIDLGMLVGPDLSMPLDLSFTMLDGATFNRANLEGVNFSGASLVRVQFGDSSMHGADLIGADASGALFVSANLRSADFTDANIDGADFMLANLADANLVSIRGFRPAQFAKACLVLKSTRVPQGFNWDNYTVPSDCCRAWSKSDDRYRLGPKGECHAASDSP